MQVTSTEAAVEVQKVVLLQKLIHILRFDAMALERRLVQEGLLLQILDAAQDGVVLNFLCVFAVIDEEVLAVKKRAVRILDHVLLNEALSQL